MNNKKVLVKDLPIGAKFKIYSQCPPCEFIKLTEPIGNGEHILCESLNDEGQYCKGQWVKFEKDVEVSVVALIISESRIIYVGDEVVCKSNFEERFGRVFDKIQNSENKKFDEFWVDIKGIKMLFIANEIEALEEWKKNTLEEKSGIGT